MKQTNQGYFSGRLIIGLMFIFSLATHAQAQTASPGDNLVVCGNSGWGGLTQQRTQAMRDKLSNTSYFGAGGSYSESTFSFTVIGNPTTANLASNNCNIWFSGYDNVAPYTALVNFTANGGFAIGACDNTSYDAACEGLGHPGVNIPNTPGGYVNFASNPLACDNGSSNTTLSLTVSGGASTYFTSGIAIARYSDAAAEPLVIVDDLTSPSMVLTGDSELFTTYGGSAVTAGSTITSDQDKFIGNVFKLAADKVTGLLDTTGNTTCEKIVLSPEVTAVKTVETFGAGYALPGNDVIYTFSVENAGNTLANDGSIIIIDRIPDEIIFFNGDIDSGGPNNYVGTDPVGWVETSSGLTLTYATDVKYSNSTTTTPTVLSDCNYTPSSGYDQAVTYICINPKGEFQNGDPNPSFAVSFRAKIK